VIVLEEVSVSISTERVLGDLHKVLADVEAMVAAAVQGNGAPTNAAAAAVERVQAQFQRARQRVREFETELEQRVRGTARAADRSIRGNPWESVAIAAAGAFVLGLILARR
jgi:ElaB/YqjD/DUF883 family membrane-anchored ribosome-binding protein